MSRTSDVKHRPLRVLISGAGIGGPVLAYWLGKVEDISVTIVERADRIRKEGQTVDLRDEGITIMKWMGVEEQVRQVTTKEKGLKFVRKDNSIAGSFPQSDDGSFTSEFEIVRGELSSIFYQASKDCAEYIFGDTIASVEERDAGAQVTFKKSQRKEEYDIVILAEGLTSRTRAMVFSEDVRTPIKSLNQWVANFSYEQTASDDQWARWFNAPGSRVLLVRPDGFGRVRAGAMVLDDGEEVREIAGSQDPVRQKEYFIKKFQNAGWETERILEGLKNATDLYVQEVAQAKCKTWSKGRVVMIGDTGYCPSPITGMGTTVCLAGAYCLAAEIVEHRHDYRSAFAKYEERLRPWVQNIQKLPPGAPGFACPKSEWGIRILHAVVFAGSLIVRSGIASLLSRIFAKLDFSNKLQLPDPALFDEAREPNNV